MADEINEKSFLAMKKCDQMPKGEEKDACYKAIADHDDKAKLNRQIGTIMVIAMPILIILGILFFVIYKHKSKK